MNITEGEYVIFKGLARDWNRAGKAYQVRDGMACVQWNGGYVTTTPVSQLTRWSQR